MTKTEIQIGRGLRETAAEVAAAWQAVEAGQTVNGSDRIHFRDWAARCAVLTPKRYELLRHLRKSPETGIRTLARALKRDVKNVHSDVAALAELGLVIRAEDGGLSSDIDEITSVIQIAA